MASLFYLGTATSTAQVDTLTVGGTIENDDIFNVILADQAGTTTTLAVVSGSTVVATVCTTIRDAFNASTNSLFTGITATATATTVILTADTAGVPFICTVTTTETGGGGADAQTFSRAATTANSGGSDWNTALNWSTGIVPVSTDSVVLDGRMTAAITYGLNQSAVTLTALRIDKSAAYNIGTTTYDLKISATTIDIGLPPSDGSSPSMAALIRLNVGTAQTSATIHGTRDVGTGGQPPVQIIGTHASNAVVVKGNSIVGIGTSVPAVAATVLTLNVKDSAKVEVGSGVTLATVNPEGGTIILNCAATTVAYGVGTVLTQGSGAITTVNVGGHFVGNSTGTITTLNISGKGFADFTQSTAARTVTSAFVYGESAKASFACGVPLAVAVTNGVDCLAGAETAQINFGDTVNVQQAAN